MIPKTDNTLQLKYITKFMEQN